MMIESSQTVFSLRPARAQDEKFWIELHHAAERATVVRQFGPWDEALQDDFAKQNWADLRGERWIVQVGGHDCGFWHVIELPDNFYIANIVLHPAYQGRGIGRALLSGLQERAKHLDKPITLQTLFENTARQFYEKLGFVVTGKSETHWKLRWEPR